MTIIGSEAMLTNGTAVIGANNHDANVSTDLTDSSFIPVITATAEGNENIYVEFIEFSGGNWKFRINRSTGFGQPALNVFWKVIALKPHKEV